MRRGRFEQAEGGTLFLDEIGDMPAELQTRLRYRTASPSGGHQPIKANVRVVAATTRTSMSASARLFREDCITA
jgi:two-component system nitrogen regulation response regulator GlnG